VGGEQNLKRLLLAARRDEQLAEVDVRADVRGLRGERAAEQTLGVLRPLLLRPHDAEQVERVGVARRTGQHGSEQTFRLGQSTFAYRPDRLLQTAKVNLVTAPALCPRSGER
jgi:hypothetical protein